MLSKKAAAFGLGAVALAVLVSAAVRVLDTPSRPYDAEANTVGNEYDAWAEVRPNTSIS